MEYSVATASAAAASGVVYYSTATSFYVVAAFADLEADTGAHADPAPDESKISVLPMDGTA